MILHFPTLPSLHGVGRAGRGYMGSVSQPHTPLRFVRGYY